MNFEFAIVELRLGKMLRRASWNEGEFIFKQVPASVPLTTIPVMTSVPEKVKEEMLKREEPMAYSHQIAHVTPQGINSWAAMADDIFGNDWEVHK